MKNVLLIIDSLGKGGAENSLAKLSVALAESNKVHILIFFGSEKIIWDIKGEIININVPPSNSFFESFINIVKRLRRIKKIKKIFKIDTSISFMEAMNFYNILSRTKDKIIISIRGSKVGDLENNGLKGVLINWLIKILYNKADIIVPVSEGIKNELITHYAVKEKKIITLYDLYDLDKINQLSYENIEDEIIDIFKYPVLINSGRLHIQKGQKHLLRIFSLVKNINPNVKLIILGDGHMKDELFDEANMLGLNVYYYWMDNQLNSTYDVYFLGFKNNPYKYIRRSKLFLFPSLYEGFPNALCEAMALGIPSISSDCPTGPKEIFSDTNDLSNTIYKKYGILMSPFELQFDNASLYLDWCQAVLFLLDNPEYYDEYSKKSITRIKEFSFEIGSKKWNALI